MKIQAGDLHDYLSATTRVAESHAKEAPQLMYLVHQMDQIFQQEIFAHEFDGDAIAGLLIVNAYTMLLSSIREALSGHVVATFPISRTALESACYAFLIACDGTRADVWFNRHDSEEAHKNSRDVFTVAKAVKALRPVCATMAEYVEALYAASIDFGAHPNRKTVINHLENSGPAGNDMHGFSLTGVYGHNSWHVNLALLVCVEMGQAIAFLAAASGKNHPLINERVHVYQEWMDAKNQMVEELNGEPMPSTGPMYTSFAPPQVEISSPGRRA